MKELKTVIQFLRIEWEGGPQTDWEAAVNMYTPVYRRAPPKARPQEAQWRARHVSIGEVLVTFSHPAMRDSTAGMKEAGTNWQQINLLDHTEGPLLIVVLGQWEAFGVGLL